MTSSQVQILDKVETEGAFAFDLKCMGRRRHASTQLSGHKCIRQRGAAERAMLLQLKGPSFKSYLVHFQMCHCEKVFVTVIIAFVLQF